MATDDQGSSAPLLTRRVTLPPERESAREARRALREALEQTGKEELIDDAQLALSEIVTNAALHAHTDIEVLMRVFAGSVCVEVRDLERSVPVQRHYSTDATTGRGMALVASLARRCGVQRMGEAGKVIWFCIGDEDVVPASEEGVEWDIEGLAPDPQDCATTDVVLLHMPVKLWLAAREHHDAIIRELGYHLAEHPGDDLDIAAADRARACISGSLVATLDPDGVASVVAAADLPEAKELPEQVDLHVSVLSESAEMFCALQDVLDTAEALARDGQLLVRPGLPEIVAVRDWACEQVVAQLAGIPPSPWPGAEQKGFETDVRGRSAPTGGWDEASVTEAEHAIVAADDANRIIAVSEPLARLLGWERERLVGRRVVTIVPPALREAHVAGFSRHLTTGESHLLGTAVELPVLRADGTEIRCRLLIERAPASRGRAVYVASVDPL